MPMYLPVNQHEVYRFTSERLIVGRRVNLNDSIDWISIGANDLHEIIIQTTANGNRSDQAGATVADFDTGNGIIAQPTETPIGKHIAKRKE